MSDSSDSGSAASSRAPSPSPPPQAQPTTEKRSSNKSQSRRTDRPLNEHEVAQIELLSQLLAQKSANDASFAAPAVDLAAMDRKGRNKLEKALRREFRLPKSDRPPPPPAVQTPASASARAVETEARTCARLAAMLEAGLLPPKLAEAATKLSSRGRNPFTDAARVAAATMAAKASADGAASAAAAAAPATAAASASPDLSPLTEAEHAWAKSVLKEARRSAKESASAERTALRSGRKRADVAERYRLPPELHIPQELILSNPIANARRVEKESKLFKYKRNAPNYAELVAKVRKEFLDALPTALGAGSASGVDGNAQSVRSGWDARTTLTAVFEDEPPEPSPQEKEQQLLNEEQEQEDGPPRKKSKQESGVVAAASNSSSSGTSLSRLHESYTPRFVSSFSWLPERDSLRKSSVDPLDPASVLSYASSRMVQPGAPYAYLQPQLPLVFRPNQKGFEVDKPGIAALIMAATRAGVAFEQENSAEPAKEGEDGGGKVKKEKKKRKKESDSSDVAAIAASSSASSSSVPRLRFVSYRNNFRKFFNRRDAWRVDIQRVGRSVFLRRHLNYNYVNPFDVGHLFEQACKESNVLQAVAAANGVAPKGKAAVKARKEDSTTHPYRAVVAAQLREFDLLTSIEIDLYQKHNAAATAAADIADDEADADADAADAPAPQYSIPSNVSFPPNPLDCFLELKTVKKPRWDKAKKSDVWVQTFLGGVRKTIVGYKREHREASAKELRKERKRARAEAHRKGEEFVEEKKKGKVSQRAHMSAAALAAKEGERPVEISEIHEAPTALLIDPHSKEQLMKRFYSVLRFLAQHVQEGKVYKLEHRRKEEAQQAGKPFVHPSRAGAAAAAAAASAASSSSSAASSAPPSLPPWKQSPAQQHASHSSNWTIVLEEISGAMDTQPVIVPGLIAHVDQWALRQKQKDDASAAAAAATNDKDDDEEMEDDSDAKKKNKSTKKKKSSSSSGSGGSEKKKSKSDKKKKVKKEEGDEADASASASASADGATSSDKKKKTKKSSKSDKKKKSSKKVKKEDQSDSSDDDQ